MYKNAFLVSTEKVWLLTLVNLFKAQFNLSDLGQAEEPDFLIC